MNRHLKTAFVVSPFLLIGGYIIADYFQTKKEHDYFEARGPQFKAVELKLDNGCELVKDKCMLRSGSLSLKLFVSGGRYRLISSHRLEDVTMALAQQDKETRALLLRPHEDQQQWSTAVRTLTNLDMDKPLKIRMVAKSNDIQYYAEFPINPAGPWNE
jgi:hypothetical protein